MLDLETAWEGTVGEQCWWDHARPVAQPSPLWEPEDAGAWKGQEGGGDSKRLEL